MTVWPHKGKENTDQTVALALQKARELGIKHIVVASNSGATAKKFLGRQLNVVCVTHQVGFDQPGQDEIPPEARQELLGQGAKIYTGTHLMAGLDRACRFKFQGVYPAEIIASALRMLGQGLKVAVEITVSALDAGMIPYGEEIIAVAGSSTGADTAIVIAPAHSQHFFDTQIREIVCMPREK